MISLVLVVPAALKDAADRVSVALGHADPGVETYVVPLAADEAGPATHYAAHAWVTDGFVAVLEAARDGLALPPASWGSVGLTAADVYAVTSALTISTRADGAHDGHFGDVSAALGLARLADPDTSQP